LHYDKTDDCEDCGSDLELGFIPDRAEKNIMYPNYWYAGSPKKKESLGWKTAEIEEPEKDKRLAIIAYGCQSCSLLKLFAHTD
jgi:hypothetical protein